MIPTLGYGWVHVVDPLIAWAVPVVVVDDSAGLQVGVDRDRAHVLKAALFQILADPVRQAVADGNRAGVMSLVQDGFALGPGPDVIAEAPKFLSYLLVASGIVDHCPDLARRADHAFCI